MINYFFSRSMNRFDTLAAWVVGAYYFSGSVGVWGAAGLIVAGALLSVIGEQINQRRR